MKDGMKLFWIIFCFSVLYSGCTILGECEKILLSKEDKLWIQAYDEGDTIIFVSDSSNSDTLLVNNVFTFISDCNKFEKGDYQYEEGGFNLDPIGCHCTNKEMCSIWINFSNDLKKADELSSKTFSVFNLKVSSIENFNTIPLVNVRLNSNDKVYECYHFQFGDGVTHDLGGKLESFYWNRESGLIKYVMKNGEKYELVAY